ncbi:MAG TPA: hypothetical protein VGN93_17745 [Shinella sp.]|jgi:hypothetical protein|uniref:hypothetical protein n=1 Tax=Shinella sp. TaxID=1870904 RepID=UPI002E1503CE|nr:hypothetical protein [Shinella sp.]
MRFFLTEYKVAKRLKLTLKECATLREWDTFPVGVRVGGACLAVYDAAEVEQFFIDSRPGGRLHPTIEYLLGRALEM